MVIFCHFTKLLHLVGTFVYARRSNTCGWSSWIVVVVLVWLVSIGTAGGTMEANFFLKKSPWLGLLRKWTHFSSRWKGKGLSSELKKIKMFLSGELDMSSSVHCSFSWRQNSHSARPVQSSTWCSIFRSLNSSLFKFKAFSVLFSVNLNMPSVQTPNNPTPEL